MAQKVKNPPAMQVTKEMRVQSLGQEDPSEEKMATYSSILAWEIPRTEEPGGLQFKRSKELDTTEHTCTHASDFSKGVNNDSLSYYSEPLSHTCSKEFIVFSNIA